MGKPYREVQRRILHLLHDHKTRRKLPEIHAHFLRHGLDQSNEVLAHFVSICGSLNKMAYASHIFNLSQSPNMLLFNSMIKGFSVCGPFEQSLHLFSVMKRKSIWPDRYTFAPLLKACSNLRNYKTGQCIHSHVLRGGLERFGSIRIGIIELYVSCLRMDDAKKMFDEMTHRDVIVWNLMVRGFCKAGDVDTGLNLFRQMRERSVVSWNSMISCLAQSGQDAEALDLFHEMRDQGFEPDDATVVTVLPICARLGTVDIGQWLHSYSDSKGFLRDITSVGNSLMDFFCKCGNLDHACDIFNQMHRKDVISWNVMISGMALNGKGRRGVELFEEMVELGVKPYEATFVGVLTCCAHAGLVEEGRSLFASMARLHRVNPKLEHYGCMVDILGRSGCVIEAHDLIRRMPMKPNAILWGSLLSSCRTYGNLELAETALHELINLEPWNSGNYILLSNMYAEEGKWDKVKKVRQLMKEKCVAKAPGQSAVGLG